MNVVHSVGFAMGDGFGGFYLNSRSEKYGVEENQFEDYGIVNTVEWRMEDQQT